MSVKETIHNERFSDYAVVVHELDTGQYDVVIQFTNTNVGVSVETVLTRHHALKGAKQLPIFIDIARMQGFHLTDHYFRHPDGRELHSSYAMDLDCTEERFIRLLNVNA